MLDVANIFMYNFATKKSEGPVAALTRVGGTSWEEVLTVWKKSEEGFGWDKVWRGRGFDSWEQWRLAYANALSLRSRTWTLHKLARDPRVFAATLCAGAFNGWRRYFPEGENRATMAEIASHPLIAANEKMAGITTHQPDETTIMLLRHDLDLIVFEGMHRCAALAFMGIHEIPCDMEVNVVVADFDRFDKNIFDKARTLGCAPWLQETTGA